MRVFLYLTSHLFNNIFYLLSARKHQFFRYACHKNAHLRKANSAFSEFFAGAQETASLSSQASKLAFSYLTLSFPASTIFRYKSS